MRFSVHAAICLLLMSGHAHAGNLQSSVPAASALCRSAILLAERATRVPDRLLNAIATVESGRRDPASGQVYPWPWAINVEGVGHFYDSKVEAIAAVRGFQAQGVRSIDVGCMQVNLMYHAEAFASLEQAFDPVANADYAAHFLTRLFTQTNAWPRAAAAYHSWTPDLGADYARKVLAAWGVPQSQLTAMDAAAITALSQAGPSQPVPSEPMAAGSYTAPSGGRIAVMMPSGSNGIRVMALGGPTPNGPPGAIQGSGLTGRGLGNYRSTPIMAVGRLAQVFNSRPPRPSGF